MAPLSRVVAVARAHRDQTRVLVCHFSAAPRQLCKTKSLSHTEPVETATVRKRLPSSSATARKHAPTSGGTSGCEMMRHLQCLDRRRSTSGTRTYHEQSAHGYAARERLAGRDARRRVAHEAT